MLFRLSYNIIKKVNVLENVLHNSYNIPVKYYLHTHVEPTNLSIGTCSVHATLKSLGGSGDECTHATVPSTLLAVIVTGNLLYYYH